MGAEIVSWRVSTSDELELAKPESDRLGSATKDDSDVPIRDAAQLKMRQKAILIVRPGG
jgi:hypothetical protein